MTPEKQHIKASQRRSSGVVRTVSGELFCVNPSSPSNISLKSFREYWLDGLDTLYSPLFDALCYRCGKLLWGPIGVGHKFTFPRNTGEIRTQTLFGVPQPQPKPKLVVQRAGTRKGRESRRGPRQCETPQATTPAQNREHEGPRGSAGGEAEEPRVPHQSPKQYRAS